MSELDSLSDSEWLEISSNQESDNDSLSSRDSDHDDLASMPPSRRSSISVGSSLDGEIDAWEGFADDSPEEPGDAVVAAFATAEHAAGPRRMLDSQGNISEEQFVTTALEQSLVGTLSASRSSSLGVSSTVHNSLRDLRLSFPDPITSSRDELNRSYEAVSSTDCITDDDSNSPMTTDFPGEAREELPRKDESSDRALEPLSGLLPVHRQVGHQINDFDLVLYGSTPQSRDFAQWLLSTFVAGGALLSSEDHSNTRSRHRFFSEATATIRDGDVPSSQISDRPSLAIVSLPASASCLPEHTLYLPIIFPSASALGLSSSSQAYESWFSVNMPAIRTLRLLEGSDNKESWIAVDGPELRSRVDPKFVYRQLGSLSTPHTKKAYGMLEQLRPVHAVTFVALLSLIMGFAVNTAFRSSSLVPTSVTSPIAPVQTTPSGFWDMFGTASNSTVPTLTSVSCTGNMGIMPSTLKDFALAVFNPATTTPSIQIGSISVAPSPSGACKSGTTGSPVGECKLMTWSERTKSTKDVIVRPPTALSNPQTAKSPPTHTPSVGGNTEKALPIRDSMPVTALSLKVVDSLSQVADATLKALEEVVPLEFKELMAALDSLMRAVGRQTTMIIADSKSRAQILRERLQYRNERAKGKARELKQRGEQLVSLASERLMARAEIAKRRAHSLKKSFVSSSVWRTYAQAHGEWSEKLETRTKRGKRRDGKHERKVGLFAKLKQKRENRKKRVSA
ncbi:hypothetical protein B0H17DRAFT_1033760 [Mycena rosella]|uniref:Uncharacterized protein n=1 Tax=Mycena rosella TaxID=1033263 RepID=A0AAD7GYB7_MYCRO|nr:hypothetical protein B0H17DRAFT_1033760 [Mycena rosella]